MTKTDRETKHTNRHEKKKTGKKKKKKADTENIYVQLFKETSGFLVPQTLLHETLHQVHWQREDDGGVLLGGDGAESLQVAQLQSGRRLADDVSSFLQCT